MAVTPRVLVTRAPHQASALAEALRARGLEPVLIPTIEIASPASWCALDAALVCLRSYEWVIFTSANGVEAFAARCKQLGVAAAPRRAAAVGAATANALRVLGITPELVPAVAVAESLAEALVPYARQPDGSSTPMLWVRGEDARPVIAMTLAEAGASVTSVVAYRNAVPASSIEAIRSAFTGESRIAAISFTSGSSVTNLLALLKAAKLTLPPEILRVSIGPITSRTMEDAGLPPHAQAREANIASLAEAVAETIAAGRED